MNAATQAPHRLPMLLLMLLLPGLLPLGVMACGGGSRLLLLRLQREGRRPMGALDAVNGRQIVIGDRLEGLDPGPDVVVRCERGSEGQAGQKREKGETDEYAR